LPILRDSDFRRLVTVRDRWSRHLSEETQR
jgi:hypothetical protein